MDWNFVKSVLVFEISRSWKRLGHEEKRKIGLSCLSHQLLDWLRYRSSRSNHIHIRNSLKYTLHRIDILPYHPHSHGTTREDSRSHVGSPSHPQYIGTTNGYFSRYKRRAVIMIDPGYCFIFHFLCFTSLAICKRGSACSRGNHCWRATCHTHNTLHPRSDLQRTYAQ